MLLDWDPTETKENLKNTPQVPLILMRPQDFFLARPSKDACEDLKEESPWSVV